MKSQDIRKKFQNYFTAHEHLWVKSSTLIPDGDSSLLFTNAGMNPFKDFFLGLKSPPHLQLCSIQKCMRAGGKHNDLEEVGYSPYHHTFFEMMGNFSFGSYFKPEAIDYALRFLTKELNLPKENLWVSVFEEDQESFEIWKKKQGFPEKKIFRLGEKDNFWRMGDTGPSGSCSEIYYYGGSKKDPSLKDMTEVWNLVFMEFKEFFKGRTKVREKLPVPCVDTGMGLERLSTVLQEKQNNYHTDLFKDILIAIEKASGVKYDFTREEKTEEQAEKQVAFRVIADHSRAVSFLICDGVLPGSEGASYVLRRILRRAFFYSHKLKPKGELLSEAVNPALDIMANLYPELKTEKNFITSTIKEEYNIFNQSLKEGQNVFLKKTKKLFDKKIPDNMVWDLYSTYGFPPDLTRLIGKEKGFKVNENFNLEKFKNKQVRPFQKPSIKASLKAFLEGPGLYFQKTENAFLTKQAKKSMQAGFKFSSENPLLSEKDREIERQKASFSSLKNKTEFTGYKKDEEKAKALFLLAIEEPLEEATKGRAVSPNQPHHPRALEEATKREGGLPPARFNPFPLHYVQKDPTGMKGQKMFLNDPAPSFLKEEKNQKNIKELWLITDKTCFYPEGGGPRGDRGFIEWSYTDSNGQEQLGKAFVVDCQKTGPFIAHKIKIREGKLKLGHICKMKVDPEWRKLIATAHSATHLLNHALRALLGKSSQQMGSLVEPGKLRFDFNSKPLNDKQLKKIEQKIKNQIQAGVGVTDNTCSYEQAIREGAVFLPGENYETKVRVIRMGQSFELCGGIHVKNTADIEDFKIISETGAQSGVRRIHALTSSVLKKWLKLLAKQNQELRAYINTNPQVMGTGESEALEFFSAKNQDQGSEAQNPFIHWFKEKEEEIKHLKIKLKQNVFSKDSSKNPEIKLEMTNTKNIKKYLNQTNPDITFQALQNEELRKYLNLSLPKLETKVEQDQQEKSFLETQTLNEKENPFIPLFRKKIEEVNQLKKQINTLLKKDIKTIIKKAIPFQRQNIKGFLLITSFPIEDRKILADLVDQLKSFLPGPGLVGILGESEKKQYPIVLALSKDLQKHISAGELLKNHLAPQFNGKGGGQARFAQGSLTIKNLKEMEKVLLDILNNK